MTRLLLLTAALLATSMPGLGVNTDTATVKDAHHRGGAAPLLSLGGAPAPSPTHSTAAPASTPAHIGPSKASRSRTNPKPPVTGKLTNTTCYAATGSRTASGKWPRVGMAASNRYRFGTRLRVQHVGVVVVEDRIGHGSELDIFGPSEAFCRRFGRQHLRVQAVP